MTFSDRRMQKNGKFGISDDSCRRRHSPLYILRPCQNVYFIGAPITSKLKRWEAVRPLVAGRMVNCYSTADWLLPIIHRAATGKSKPVAGVMVSIKS